MIKKGLLSLFVGFVGLIGFSYGGWVSYALNTNFNDPLGSQNVLAVANKGNLLTSLGGIGKNVLFFGPRPGYSYKGFMYWTLDKKLYSFVKYTNGTKQGELMYMAFCDYFDSSLTNMPTNCSNIAYNIDLVSSYLGSLSNTDSFTVYTNYSNSLGINAICFSNLSQNNSLCFCGGSSSMGGSSNPINCGLTNSKNYSSDIDFGTLSIDDLGYSPGSGGGNSGGGNNGGTVSNSLNNSSAVDYLESVYNFNKSLCYVGIDDLSVNYGGAGSFIQGGGKTIFELFDYINGTSESVSNVGVWINSRIINYQQWFDNNGKTAEPTYLTNYSNGQISVYYDNLTFPFLNKPAGLYFMANNLYDSSVSSNGNMGQELAIYCDLKLNGENASPIPDDSDLYKNVINYEYFNKNNGNSYYDGSGNLIIYQEPGEDSIFNDDYFGDYSGNYTDYFKGYEEIFNNFTSKFNIREYRAIGIIPGYILFFLALVILFKLIRK